MQRTITKQPRRSRPRARHGAAIVGMPDRPVHPLRVLVQRKGLSLAQAAEMLSWSLRKLMAVVCEWHRPSDAQSVAICFGVDPDELFPPRPEAGRARSSLDSSAEGKRDAPTDPNPLGPLARAIGRRSGQQNET